MSGFTLQLWIIFMNILPWAVWTNDCTQLIFETELTDEDGVIEVHECIKDHRSNILGGATFLLLGYPIVIAHCYYEHRIHETLGAFLNIGLSRWLYYSSWMIAATILCTFIPALLIFVGYYDWEFGYNMEYVGYAMQLQFLHFGLITYDCIIIPLGIAAAIPWLWTMIIFIGDTPIKCCQWYKSAHYKLSNEDRVKLFKHVTKCPCMGRFCGAIFSFTLICICIFGAFGDVFDYAKDGFFSYHGGSQFLAVVLYLSWQIQAILEMRGGCILDTTTTFLNDKIQGMSTQDAIINNGNNNNSGVTQLETFDNVNSGGGNTNTKDDDPYDNL